MNAIRLTRPAVALACAGALLLAVLAAAPQADASTTYVCVKKRGGTARFVTKKAKCRRGETRVSWNSAGPAGKNGRDGNGGANGANGATGVVGGNGANGAVAGYSALQGGGLLLNGSFASVGGLEKVLPAGSFIASANIEIEGSAETAESFAIAECELVDAVGGKSSVLVGAWGSPFLKIASTEYVAYGEIPLNSAFSNATPSTLSVKCKIFAGGGAVLKVTAAHGSLVAVQTSANS